MVKVGDRVKCINAKGHNNELGHSGLKEGREYIVYAIKTCPSCGALSYDVGIFSPRPDSNSVCTCGNRVPNNGIWWAGARRFVKQEEKINYVKLNVKIEEPILN